MTEPILARTLEAYAERSGSIRPDMLALVERGYLRRRRRQQFGSAAGGLAVAAIITVAAVLHPFGGTRSLRPQPAVPLPVSIPAPSATPSPAASSHPSGPVTTAEPKPLLCPLVSGAPQAPKQVLSLLVAASKVNEYQTAHLDPTVLDSRLHGILPDVHIPLPMLKAVAAEESSWTSTCISSDGIAYGTMQVGQAVNDQMNTRFQTTFDRLLPADNILLGNAYLEYLTVHFGILYFHNDFNLATNIPLRDAVLAAYDVGLSGVDPNGTGIQIGPIGQTYVTTVVGLMSPNQACQRTWGH